MRDIELYKQLLGLESPWTVSRVELEVSERRVAVWAEHKKLRYWPCPECGVNCGLHDHDQERSWRHLDSCQFQTLLKARVPRVQCPEHGVRVVAVPWAEARSRFTVLFERFAIDVLLETNVEGASKILGISWDQAQHLMERAVARGLERREDAQPTVLGIDEKAIAKGHRYATLVNDLEKGIVIDVTEGRTKESLLDALGSFSLNDLSAVKAVAMDMWDPYFQLLRQVLPDASQKIVFDRFHIVGHMNEALDKVRRAENRALIADGDERLVGSKQMWLYGFENLPKRYQLDFGKLRKAKLKTARVWAIKEMLRELWDQPSEQAAVKWLKRWCVWVKRTGLAPVEKVAKMILRHLTNILTYFTHRITNSGSEAINGVVRMLQKRAFGYRSFLNFRNVVLFRCGGLNLYPESHPNVG